MIRLASVNDAFSIAQIHIDAWRHAYIEIVPKSYLDELNIEEKTKRWEKILIESKSTTFVKEVEGEIAGWLSYGLSRDDDSHGIGEIWALYVSPKFWRMGIGSKLMKHIEEVARDSQMSSLSLWVLEENTHGRSFYEKTGYVRDSFLKNVDIGGFQLEELRYIKSVE